MGFPNTKWLLIGCFSWGFSLKLLIGIVLYILETAFVDTHNHIWLCSTSSMVPLLKAMMYQHHFLHLKIMYGDVLLCLLLFILLYKSLYYLCNLNFLYSWLSFNPFILIAIICSNSVFQVHIHYKLFFSFVKNLIASFWPDKRDGYTIICSNR